MMVFFAICLSQPGSSGCSIISLLAGEAAFWPLLLLFASAELCANHQERNANTSAILLCSQKQNDGGVKQYDETDTLKFGIFHWEKGLDYSDQSGSRSSV